MPLLNVMTSSQAEQLGSRSSSNVHDTPTNDGSSSISSSTPYGIDGVAGAGHSRPGWNVGDPSTHQLMSSAGESQYASDRFAQPSDGHFLGDAQPRQQSSHPPSDVLEISATTLDEESNLPQDVLVHRQGVLSTIGDSMISPAAQENAAVPNGGDTTGSSSRPRREDDKLARLFLIKFPQFRSSKPDQPGEESPAEANSSENEETSCCDKYFVRCSFASCSWGVVVLLAVAASSLAVVVLYATGVISMSPTGPPNPATTSTPPPSPSPTRDPLITSPPGRTKPATTSPSPTRDPLMTTSPSLPQVGDASSPMATLGPSALTTTAKTITPATIAPTHLSVGERWVQVLNDIAGEAAGDNSGFSIALSLNGTVLAVGAPSNDGRGRSSGQVRVYIDTGTNWTRLGGDLDGAAAGDQFGYSLALSADGMTLAVGAPTTNAGGRTDSGEISMHRWNGSTWIDRGSSIQGLDSSDNFGYSVALSDDGTVLAVGAPFRGRSDNGQVKVFGWNGTAWNQGGGSDINGFASSDYLGDSVALSSDGLTVACGADQSSSSSVAGYVLVHRWSGTEWVRIGEIFGFGRGDHFGESVSLSGDGTVLAVGADNGNYCAVFRYDGSTWSQIGQTLYGLGSGDRFGHSVDLSVAGDVVVVGGYGGEASNGSPFSHALVYRLIPNRDQWVQVGQNLTADWVFHEFYGRSVSISGDGTRIAVGRLDAGGNGAGVVRVYDLN